MKMESSRDHEPRPTKNQKAEDRINIGHKRYRKTTSTSHAHVMISSVLFHDGEFRNVSYTSFMNRSPSLTSVRAEPDHANIHTRNETLHADPEHCRLSQRHEQRSRAKTRLNE